MSRGIGLSVAGREIQTLIDIGVTGNLSDGQLLDRFIARREEAVFRAILLRHGSMVWGVCRRVLGDHHDAEDAFQATCLVLARKAASVMPREKVGPWLHGVAYQTALKARQNRARRRLREGPVVETAEVGASPKNGRDETSAELDRELNRLPEKYRVPIVLCELEGKSHKEAAEVLGWPIGTVSGRLSRAKTMLADRLTRRGVTLSAGSLVVLLAQNPASARVIDATAHAACLEAWKAGIVSLEVLTLTQEICKSMTLSKLKMMAIVMIASATVGVGGIGVVSRAQFQEPAPEQSAAKKIEPAKVLLQNPPAPQPKELMKAAVNSAVRPPVDERPFVGGPGGGGFPGMQGGPGGGFGGGNFGMMGGSGAGLNRGKASLLGEGAMNPPTLRAATTSSSLPPREMHSRSSISAAVRARQSDFQPKAPRLAA